MNSSVALRPDGIAHKIFRVEDIFRMAEIGVIGPNERLELVEGDLMEMSPKGARHEWLKTCLNRYFGKNCPDGIMFAPAPGWKIDEFTYLEPDFLFFGDALRIDEVKPQDALLVIEVSDSSLTFDLRTKAALYGRSGVRDYWVIDAAKRETHVHLNPKLDGYGALRTYGEDIPLEPTFISKMPVMVANMPR
jgi:Uma2 family endonuclease